jgi:hypothetical protein
VQASLVQCPADRLQNAARSWIVPVNAEGVRTYGDDLSRFCLDGSFGHHPDDASGDSLRVREDGALMGARDQRTIRLVGTVGKDLGRKRDPSFTGSSLVL